LTTFNDVNLSQQPIFKTFDYEKSIHLCYYRRDFFLRVQKRNCQQRKSYPPTPKTEITAITQRLPEAKLDLFKALAEKFLTKAKYSLDFKKMIYSACFAEPYGDYYIRIEDVLNKNEELNHEFWSIEEAQLIQNILDSIQQIDEENNDEFTQPTVFVPFIEDLAIDSLLLQCPTGTPDAAIAMEYDSSSTYCTGYNLDESNRLYDFANNIDEGYAWAHDLWVFGQEENITNGTGSADDYTQIQGDRYDGIREYGGIIQVTNIGAIEPWVSGKLELKYFVFDQYGTKIKEKEFEKTKRKKFKNWNWVDYNDFIGYWNLSNIGNWMIEAWIEVDGGGASTISQTIPPPCTGCPSTSISYSVQNHDDIMGQSIVQFTDPYSTMYGISHANFQRKTQ
jgi:hypothetical protein